jgi:single-strand DNA-binding protein
MAGSVNKVILVGNLGRDPEVRCTQNNQKIVHLSVATSERWKDRQSGEPRERTEWHRVVIFNENLADIAERYLRKGNPVYLEGTCRPASGPTRAARSTPRPRSWSTMLARGAAGIGGRIGGRRI